MKIYKTAAAAERAAMKFAEVPAVSVPVVIRIPQVPKGAACKWAWGSHRLIAQIEIGSSRKIIAATGRLLSWKSGNWSTQAQSVVDRFTARWSGCYAVISRLEMAPKMERELISGN